LQPPRLAFVSTFFAIHHDLCPIAADFLTQAVAHIVSAFYCDTNRFRRQQLWEGPLASVPGLVPGTPASFPLCHYPILNFKQQISQALLVRSTRARAAPCQGSRRALWPSSSLSKRSCFSLDGWVTSNNDREEFSLSLTSCHPNRRASAARPSGHGDRRRVLR
jgi:hypothetical protein